MKAHNRLTPDQEHAILALVRRRRDLHRQARELEPHLAEIQNEIRTLTVAGIAKLCGHESRTVQRVIDDALLDGIL